LSSIFGTEKDKVNCPFYFKIGACRHGDKCERRHNKPSLSQTLVIPHMYQNPVVQLGYDDKKAQEEFEEFYEDIFEELSKFGEIEDLNVCDNVCDHLMGNVYVKFSKEEEAEKAFAALAGRFYAGKPLIAEYSPVTDFREASCRQYEMNECTRGGHCNFMHLKSASRELRRKLFGGRSSKRSRRSRSRSPEAVRSRHERSRSRERDRRRDRREDHRDRSERSRGRSHHEKETEHSPDSKEGRSIRRTSSRSPPSSRHSRGSHSSPKNNGTSSSHPQDSSASPKIREREREREAYELDSEA